MYWRKNIYIWCVLHKYLRCPRIRDYNILYDCMILNQYLSKHSSFVAVMALLLVVRPVKAWWRESEQRVCVRTTGVQGTGGRAFGQKVLGWRRQQSEYERKRNGRELWRSRAGARSISKTHHGRSLAVRPPPLVYQRWHTPPTEYSYSFE